MPPVLLHIYGPIAIHSFGLMIVIGFLITLHFLQKDTSLQKLISQDQLFTLIQICFITGILGGRLWFLCINYSMFPSWVEMLQIWSGGLSVLGAILGAWAGLSAYLMYASLPILPVLDRLALYTPLLQSISRIGCFFAGCCYGKACNLSWAVIYTNPESLAPLHIFIHPTQLYSSIVLASIFLFLYSFDRYCKGRKNGQILFLYLLLTSCERFFIDFIRADQDGMITTRFFGQISAQQNLSLWLGFIGLCGMIFVTFYQKQDELI